MRFLPGQIPTAEDFGDGPSSYIPVLTSNDANPALGSTGEAVGWFARVGSMVFGGARFTFNGSGISAGNGNYRISLPIALDTSLVATSTTTNQTIMIGGGRVRDQNAAANSINVVLQPITSVTVAMVVPGVNTTVSNNQPASGWVVAGSRISVYFAYPANWQ